MNRTLDAVRIILRGASVSLIIASSLFSQPQYLRFDHLSVMDGLSQDIVTCIVQDSQGFMWFGTEDGLNRYDGYSIRVFKNNPRDSTSISGNDIHDLFEDSRHRFWIATSSGLNLFNRTNDSFLRFHHDPRDSLTISSDATRCVREDTNGDLWVGTDFGLNRLDQQTGRFIRYLSDSRDPKSLSSNGIRRLMLDRDGTLWIATENGFCSFNSEQNNFARYLRSEENSRTTVITKILQDQTGRIWASPIEQGLWWLDPRTKKLHHLPMPQKPQPLGISKIVADPVVNALGLDRSGFIWIGHFRGLDVHNPQTGLFSHFPIRSDAPTALGGRVESIYMDRVGVMWLGTYQSGIYRFDPLRQRFLLYQNDPKSPASIGSNHISAIFERGGIVWIGTDRGLDRFDPKTNIFSHYRHTVDPGSLGMNQVNAILEDRRGNLWIGGVNEFGSGLDRFDSIRKRFVHYPFRSVQSLHEDRDGELWVGTIDEKDTGNNLLRLNRAWNVIGRYSPPGTGVWNIFEDRKGGLWLGGQYCCLSRFDKHTGSFEYFEVDVNDTTALSSGAVRTMFEDSTGNFWLGTWGGGLLRYDPRTAKFSRYLEYDGLPSKYVKSILQDDQGLLWIATEGGLSRFNPATSTFRNFSMNDGLQGDRFLSGSCFKSKNGQMYFGGTNGLNVFHPDSIRDNSNTPPIVITEFKVFDKTMPFPQTFAGTEEINLSHDQDFFSFEFVALDYTNPRKNQYAYMLEGFDPQWVNAGTRRYAAYTGVHPGTYVFRVRASNGDGTWNNDGTTLRISIAPPFWQTWWFLTLASLSFAALLYALFQYRINQLLAIEHLRSRIAGDLHDEVGTDLSSIVLAAQAIERSLKRSPRQRDEVRRIRRIAGRTQDMMRDIVWVLNSKNDTMVDMVLKMREVAERVLMGLSYSFKGLETPLPERLSLEFKRNIFLFYKECLNNVVRHSSATKVTVEMVFTNGELVLQISDNGKGFNPDLPAAGLGLKSLQSRASALGGSVVIASHKGSGTVITLKVRIT